MGSPEELQSAPATPFVLHFIDDVNLMPANCQFVRRLGFKTEKPYVMCRPTVFDVRPSFCWTCMWHFPKAQATASLPCTCFITTLLFHVDPALPGLQVREAVIY